MYNRKDYDTIQDLTYGSSSYGSSAFGGVSTLVLTCPSGLKYSGNTITLKATPKDGIGPYYVVFRKNGVTIDPSRLGGLDNPIINAPENTEITRIYTLNDADIAGATTGTIDFSVYMEDSCPTGSRTCAQTCTITIGCLAPICNFVVT
jgi:hypothetical protein